MFVTYAIFSLVLWTIFGSLWSVLLERLQDKHDRKTIKSILIGRSQCPKCKNTLGRSELVPLASYLVQRGKCKHCKTHISAEYPILEIASGLVFFVTFRALYHGQAGDFMILNNVSTLVFWIVTNWLLMLLIIHDCKTFELHMPIWWMLMARIRWRQSSGSLGNYQEALIGLIAFVILFTAIYFFGKRYVKMRFKSNEEGFGQGDIFIGATLWSLLPFIGNINQFTISWTTAGEIGLIMIVLACVIGLLYFVGESLLIQKTKQKGNDLFTKWQNTNKIIPFIPALIVAFWILLYKASLFLNLIF